MKTEEQFSTFKLIPHLSGYCPEGTICCWYCSAGVNKLFGITPRWPLTPLTIKVSAQSFPGARAIRLYANYYAPQANYYLSIVANVDETYVTNLISLPEDWARQLSLGMYEHKLIHVAII